jgi:hypothetical protein
MGADMPVIITGRNPRGGAAISYWPGPRAVKEIEMKEKWIPILILALLLPSVAACYRHSGYHFYPHAPAFAPTDPARIDLLRREPRRDHVRLGEVWIRPTWRMDRNYVEWTLREKAARMGADALVIVADRYFNQGYVHGYWRGVRPVYERQIVGIAIKYTR